MSGEQLGEGPVVDLTAPRGRRGAGSVAVRVVRGTAWLLLALGVVVMLYLVYSLYFTNFRTDASQDQLRERWQEQLSGDPEPVAAAPTPAAPSPTPTPSSSDDPVVGTPSPAPPGGDAVALMWFERPGGDPPVTEEEYVIVDGTSQADLVQGPGHYTQTADPGEEGNFVVAGQRTTFNRAKAISSMDREGSTFVYRYVRQEIVPPTRMSVLDDDPLGTGSPTITLTTCHPRFSNRQRLIAFGELVT